MKTNIKPFRIFDLLLYGVGILTVFILLCIFVIFPKKTISKGFIASINNEEIFKFYFDDNKTEIVKNDGYILETESKENEVIFTLYEKTDKSEFNVIKANLKEKSVEVVDSNCSTSKNCVHTPAVKDGKGAIICLPHGLKISPISAEYTPVVVG